jgi:hypothetical protein
LRRPIETLILHRRSLASRGIIENTMHPADNNKHASSSAGTRREICHGTAALACTPSTTHSRQAGSF